MKRGNRRLPTAVKEARGTLRPCRENPDEPKLRAPGSQDPPADLDGEGLAEWRRLAPVIFGTIVSDGDVETFAAYCRTLTLLRRVQRVAARSNVDVAIAKGYVSQALKLTTQFRQLAAELGLTPSSRGSVKAVEKKQPGTVEQFLRRVK